MSYSGISQAVLALAKEAVAVTPLPDNDGTREDWRKGNKITDGKKLPSEAYWYYIPLSYEQLTNI